MSTLVRLKVNNIEATLNGGTFAATVSLADGTNTVTAEIVDKVGREASDSITLDIDGTAPVISNIQPVDGSWVNTPLVTIAGNVADNNIQSVTVNGIDATILGDLFSATDVPLHTEGSNTVVITAVDNANNESSVSIIIKRDTVLPVLSILPTDEATNVSAYTRFIVDYEDSLSGLDFTSLTITLNGADVTNTFRMKEMQAVRDPGPVPLAVRLGRSEDVSPAAED